MTFLVVTETSLIFIMFIITFKVLSCAHNNTATSNQLYISPIRLCSFQSKHLGRCFAQLISKELTIFLKIIEMIFNKCTLMIIFQFNPQITVLCDNNFLAEIKKILFYYPVKTMLHRWMTHSEPPSSAELT